MTRFLLIRHASNDTVGKTIAGRMPRVHLNEEGKLQAQELAERLKAITIDSIYCSPLERCLETAEPLAQKLHLDLSIADEFAEIEYGAWTNCTLEELKDSKQFHNWNTFRSGTRTPGGETMIEVQARVIAGLQKLFQKHPGQTVAVVSHGDPIKAALAFYSGMPLDLLLRMEISPASVSIVDVYDDWVQLQTINNGELKNWS